MPRNSHQGAQEAGKGGPEQRHAIVNGMHNQEAYEWPQRQGANPLRAPANVGERCQRFVDAAFRLLRAFQVARECQLIVAVEGIGKFFADEMPQQTLTSLFRDIFAK